MLWPQKKTDTPQPPDVKLESFRLLVRTPSLNDWPDWARIRGKNRNFLKPLEPRWAEDCLTRDFFIRRLRRQKRDWEEGRTYSFLIIRKDEDRLIGGINLNHVCRGAAMHAQLGYWLDEDQQGQGYMAEAARLVIRYAFEDLKLRRINAACLPDNARSVRLLEKLSFKEEGFAKAYLQIDGQWRDHKLFGLGA